jgi:hypothetical protein
MPPPPRFLLILSHPAAAHRARRRSAPLVSHSRRVNRAPPPSPIAPQRRRSRPMAGGHCWPLHAVDRCVGPLSAPSLAPTRHRADPPPPFPSPPRALSAFKSRRPPTSLPSSIFFSIRFTRCYLPAPPLSQLVPSPVASPPRHRETEPLPASTFRPLGESGPPCVVAHKWRAPHLLPSPPVLQDPATGAARDRSTSATVGHHHAASTPPPHVEPLLG